MEKLGLLFLVEEPYWNWERYLYRAKDKRRILKRDQPILVRNSVSNKWIKRHFAGYDETMDGVIVFTEGKTSWTSSLHEKSNFYFWKLPEEE